MAVYNTITSAALESILLKDRSYNGYNANAFVIPQFFVGAWAADGSVTLADATNPALQKIVGVANTGIPSHSRGLYVQSGVVPGAIAHLSANAGDPIYLGVVPGSLTNVIPTGTGVTPIQVGTAEPDPATNLITDLKLGNVGGGGSGGGVTPLELDSAIAGSQSNNYFSGELTDTIDVFRAVCGGPSEVILAGDATDSSKIDIIGVTLAAVAPGTAGPVKYTGTIEDACTGLGAVAWQPIYLAEGPGGHLTTTPPAPSNYTVVIGCAVPRSGSSGAATDLLLDIQRTLIL